MNLIQINDALRYGSENGGLKLMFYEGKSREKWEKIKTSPFYSGMLEELKKKAASYLAEPIKPLLFSEYKIFEETGSRKEFEKSYFDRRGRLAVFAVLSLLYDQKKYIEQLEDIIWAICDEYTWCLPAHLWGQSEKQGVNPLELSDRELTDKGKIISLARKHRKYVDLFAAETGFALAEIAYLLEERLSPIVVARARMEVKERIINSFAELNRMFVFEAITNNWAAVCGGCIGAAALYTIEADNVLVPLIYRILGILDNFMEGYRDDGACAEGLGYWNYGFGFYTFFAELLRQRTVGKIDLLNNEKAKKIAMFQQKCYMSRDNVVSFSDVGRTSKFNLGLTHFLKNKYPAEIEIPPLEYTAHVDDDKCCRWGHIIRNFVWSNEEYKGGDLGEADYYFKDSQWLISRKIVGCNIVCFAAKGGHNDEPHNHNDIGNFILHVSGETLLNDLGSGEYTRQYFGKERYSLLCNGSQGHSVPIVNGNYQKEGKGHFAKIIDVQISDSRDFMCMDIAGAYDDDSIVSIIRSFDFNKAGSTVLALKDVYEFNRAPSSVVERFITSYQPRLVEPGKVAIRGNTSGLDMIYEPDKLECVIGKEKFINHSAQMEDVYIIDLRVKTLSLKEEINVFFKIV